jgi:HK97 family phage portal protein
MATPLGIAQAVVNAAWKATHPSKELVPTEKATPSNLSPVGRGGWWGILREGFTGAWQQNSVPINNDTVLSYTAVYRSIALIASDIGKLRVVLKQVDDNNIWTEVKGSPYFLVLKKPNNYQNRIQFFMSWLQSKLIEGNTYVLKKRDKRGIVTDMYVLDPNLVTPLVAPNGDVYYQLQSDNLSGLFRMEQLIVPAKEIIHDRGLCINHPLIGVSPIYACGLAAMQGVKIISNSAKFFTFGARPSGVLSAPGSIDDVTAQRFKEYWENEFAGDKIGKVAVLGNGLKYEPMSMTAVDAQLIEQLKWSAEMVASAFGVPAYKIGVGPLPTYNNIEALDTQYFSQCLQIHIEQIELGLDEGLELPSSYGTEFDLEGLLRMDTSTAVQAESQAVGAGIKAINEARRRFDLPPVEGGETPYLQQQNYSLKALAERDKTNPLVAPPTPPAPKQETNPPTNGAVPPPSSPNEPTSQTDQATQKALVLAITMEAGRILSNWNMEEKTMEDDLVDDVPVEELKD